MRYLVGPTSQDSGGLMVAVETNARRHVQLTAAQVAAQYSARPNTVADVVQYFTGEDFVYLGEELDGCR